MKGYLEAIRCLTNERNMLKESTKLRNKEKVKEDIAELNKVIDYLTTVVNEFLQDQDPLMQEALTNYYFNCTTWNNAIKSGKQVSFGETYFHTTLTRICERRYR